MARYNVHRAHDGRLHAVRGQPDRAADATTSYTDTGLAAGDYYYRVTAEDAAGNVAPRRSAERTVTVDATAPTVSITAPAAGATVCGTRST